MLVTVWLFRLIRARVRAREKNVSLLMSSTRHGYKLHPTNHYPVSTNKTAVGNQRFELWVRVESVYSGSWGFMGARPWLLGITVPPLECRRSWQLIVCFLSGLGSNYILCLQDPLCWSWGSSAEWSMISLTSPIFSVSVMQGVLRKKIKHPGSDFFLRPLGRD